MPWTTSLGQPGRNPIPLKHQTFSSHIRMKTRPTTFLWEKGRILQSEPLLKIITRKATGWGQVFLPHSEKGLKSRSPTPWVSRARHKHTKLQALQGNPDVQTRNPGVTATVEGCRFQGALQQGWCQDYGARCRTDTAIILLSLCEAEELQTGILWVRERERETFRTFLFLQGKDFTKTKNKLSTGSSCHREQPCLLPAVLSQPEGCGPHHRVWGSEFLCLNTWDTRVEVLLQREPTAPACSPLAFLYMKASVFRTTLQPPCSFPWGITWPYNAQPCSGSLEAPQEMHIDFYIYQPSLK